MRIPSGKVDQNINFVALDTAGARVTGLSGFTVYRSRNGGTATVYTTPTVIELSSANMPGVYALLIDEDTTLASGSDSEEVALHITKTGMVGVTRVFELYRAEDAVVLDRADGIETGYTLRQIIRLMSAALLGKASGLATTTVVFRNVTDAKDRVTATTDTNGNRSAVTLDAS